MAADYQQYPFPKGKHPPGWVETTVGEVMLEIRSGYSSGSHNQTGQGIPHLRPMNVSPVGDISMDDVRYVSPNAGRLRLAKGDVLFTNTSSTVRVGKTALVEKSGDWGFSNHMTRLRVADGMSPEFVARQLHYLCMSGYFAFHCKKHINQSSVAGTQLAENVPFRLPPAKEQQRIIAKLRCLLDRERKLRQQLDDLPGLINQYRAAVLEAACTGRLVPTEAEVARKERRNFEPASVLLERILVERRTRWEGPRKYTEPERPGHASSIQVPEGWTVATISQVSAQIVDCPHSTPKFISDGFPCIDTTCIEPGRILDKKVRFVAESTYKDRIARLVPRHGDVVFAREGTVGTAVVVPKSVTPCLGQRVMLMRGDECILPKYFEHCLNSVVLRRQYGPMLAGSTVPHLNVSDVKRFMLLLAPLAEQERIVKEVHRRFSVIAQVESKIAASLEDTIKLRSTLFQRAMSGKFMDQRQDDEPASELLNRIRDEREKRRQMLKSKQPQRKVKMKKLSPDFVKEAITQFPRDRFSFDELTTALQADYDPLKDIIFELLAESKPSLRQVFDSKTKAMKFERIKP